jgi:hypothetical protein
MKSSLMTPDWSRVTLKDVRRACQMYDSGTARPKRPARSTFLLLNGKTYPAKSIRGLAIRKSASKPGDACLLASGWGSNGGTLGEQQSFRQLPMTNRANRLTCGLSHGQHSLR